MPKRALVRRAFTDVLVGVGLVLFFIGLYRIVGVNWTMLLVGATLTTAGVLEHARNG